MAVTKTRKRSKEVVGLPDLIQGQFPGISFVHQTYLPGQCSESQCYSKKTVVDHRGKLRLDQNDGTSVPLDQIPDNLIGKNAEIVVQKSGAFIGQNRKINFIAGTGITIEVVDDPANNRINITISHA